MSRVRGAPVGISRWMMLAATTVVAVLGTSCEGDLLGSLDERPPNIITTNQLFRDSAGFEAGLNGLYSLVRMEREGFNGGTALVAQMAINGTDNMVTNHQVNGFANIARDWRQNSPQDPFWANVFGWLYSVVNAANNIIAQAESGRADLTEEELTGYVAEARAIRAWAYRHLSYGWGDVPLSLEVSSGSTIRTDWSRTPVSEIRRQMIDDLTFAQAHLDPDASLPGRITRGAAQHYLAETYLALGDPERALEWANRVIDEPAYRLITERYGVASGAAGVPFMDMFRKGNSNREEGNSEALWVFQFAPGIGGGRVPYFRRDHHSRYVSISVGGVSPLRVTEARGGQGFGRMSLTKYAIDLYEPEDDRGSNHAIRKFFILKDAVANAPALADRLPPGWSYGDTLWLDWSNDITSTANSRTNWPFSRKADYANPANVLESPAFHDQVYLRLAETLLLKAEAQHQLGDNAGAAETINVLRRRARARDVSAGEINLDFILDERSRELVLEEHRRYTLLRTGTFLTRVRAHNRNGGQFVTERELLFPIPQTVIDANLTSPMPQNPGY